MIRGIVYYVGETVFEARVVAEENGEIDVRYLVIDKSLCNDLSLLREGACFTVLETQIVMDKPRYMTAEEIAEARRKGEELWRLLNE